jgi:hypothetical protein
MKSFKQFSEDLTSNMASFLKDKGMNPKVRSGKQPKAPERTLPTGMKPPAPKPDSIGSKID